MKLDKLLILLVLSIAPGLLIADNFPSEKELIYLFENSGLVKGDDIKIIDIMLTDKSAKRYSKAPLSANI